MWRPMTAADLPAVNDIAVAVHPSFPEDAAVFAERLALFPQGCHVLVQDGTVTGYVLSHPWHGGDPPALNSLLQRLPPAPATYYIHDLALLPVAQRGGFGVAVVRLLVEQARRMGFASMSLVAVNASEGFWRRQGFRAAGESTNAKLQSYGDDARLMTLALR